MIRLRLSRQLMAREKPTLILNPVPGGSDHTSPARARRFVRSGRAEFVGFGVIRFLSTPETKAIATRAERLLSGRATALGYDGVNRMLTPNEVRALPLILPAKMLSGERSRRDWSYRSGIVRPRLRPPVQVNTASSEGSHGKR
jgi:hypothetical protein